MVQLQLLTQIGLIEPLTLSLERITRIWQEGYGPNHLYVPAGLTRHKLLTAFVKLGQRLNWATVLSTDYASGEQLPTTAGIFHCDLTAIMRPVDIDHHPFSLDYPEQEAWSKMQGGHGLSSAEQVLYLLVRMWLAFGHLIFMGGRIRCRNLAGRDGSLSIQLYAGKGIDVVYDGRSRRYWLLGCVPERFMPLDD